MNQFFVACKWVGSIDLTKNETADHSIILERDADWAAQETSTLNDFKTVLNGEKLDAVFCVAGGWAGRNTAGLNGTPGRIGYRMAKAAVHHLTKPLADYSTWTPLQFVADLFMKWVKGYDRPQNGSLIQLITKNNNTDLVIADKKMLYIYMLHRQ